MNFEQGTIFFGTRYENIYRLDSEGVEKPFQREERYISVSASGYCGGVSCFEHKDLDLLSRIYSEELNAASLDGEGYLSWKEGYKNSLTYHDGFGPCDRPTFHRFGKHVKNDRKGQNVCALIHPSHSSSFVIPDKGADKNELPFEYLSLALHPFIKKIDPEMIFAWIGDEKNYDRIRKDMAEGLLRKKEVYLVEELSSGF
ncbi:MAG: hypothetical protein PQJ60_12620 [Spirochaetales bacterium]|nr:hypothetical protein [Spirochaetales bacterium]